MYRGCIPSKVDIRDYKITYSASDVLPAKFRLTKLPKVKDQKCVNSCVAHATSTILEYFDYQDGKGHELSTNFLYGGQKKLCGYEGQGMYLRDACEIAKDYGDPIESLCKGNDEVPDSWAVAEEALDNQEALDNAKFFKIKSYYRCDNIGAIKKAVHKYGPVLVCIKWYNDFSVDSTGVIHSTQTGDYGYHAVIIYGWNDKGFYIQNSWGRNWGKNGRAILPYEIPVEEGRVLIDDSIDIDKKDVVVPKRNSLLDIFCKIANWIINLFKK